MYDFGRPYGESCYRLMSRTGQFIYLKTRGCLEVDDKTRQVHSFVCINSLVSDDEGKRLIREMKKKFSAIISEDELSAMESDIPAVENPQKLERAILNLITNLNNSGSYDDDNVSMISDSTVENDENRRMKSPPLAIIAPKHNTIKHSIFKAAGVIGQTQGRSPSIKDEPKSPESPVVSPNPYINSLIKQRIKAETSGILSPNSCSVSSTESDISSPFLSGSHIDSVARASNPNCQATMNEMSNSCSKSEEFFPGFSAAEVDLGIAVSPGENSSSSPAPIDSLSNINNNNNSNINRNSVLKRTYKSSENDSDNPVKKRTLTAQSSPQFAVNPDSPLNLLTTSDSGNFH